VLLLVGGVVVCMGLGPRNVLSALGGFLAITFVYKSYHPRGTFAIASSNRRHFAVGIETYGVDHRRHAPPDVYTKPSGWQGPTPATSVPAILTSPVAYQRTLETDPFSAASRLRLYANGRWFARVLGETRAHFAYDTDGQTWWILWSAGPDQQFGIIDPRQLAHPNEGQFRRNLSPYTYDPTNGTVSAGDVWRIGN
jgi:hypothetical protein